MLRMTLIVKRLFEEIILGVLLVYSLEPKFLLDFKINSYNQA